MEYIGLTLEFLTRKSFSDGKNCFSGQEKFEIYRKIKSLKKQGKDELEKFRPPGLKEWKQLIRSSIE